MSIAVPVELPKGRILVVDDELAFGRVLALLLQRSGFHAEHVGSGHAAFDRVDAMAPDLVLLDWSLPDISGVQVCRKITSRPRFGRLIPVVMISGHDDDLHRRRSFDAGASEFLGKPFTRDALLRCVGSVLGATRSRGVGSAPGSPPGINTIE